MHPDKRASNQDSSPFQYPPHFSTPTEIRFMNSAVHPARARLRTGSPLDQTSTSFRQISSPVGGTRSPSRVVAEEPRRHCSGICSARRTQLSLPYISPVFSPRISASWSYIAWEQVRSHALCVSVRHDTRKAVRRIHLRQTGLHVTGCYACCARQLL